VSAAGSDPQARVLDLGTGTGDLALAFLRRADDRGRVVGMDFARPMLERARSKAGGAGALRLVQADAVSLPFRDGSFDVVSAAFVVRNIANLPEALAACHRVLRPGGRLVLLEFFRPDRLSWPLRAYVSAVVPRLGAAVSRNASAYAYLRDSQRSFLSIEEALSLFAKAGFGARRVERLFPGVAALLVLERS
jgi:demethylmenaquinone methyltransferase/2-methoxy-6-polyprenyl-1,4-benzoquinol methylase